jgi:cytochrome b6-f complex iron-sulfur subunit
MPRETFWLAPQDRIRVYVSIAALAGVLVAVMTSVAVFLSFISPTDEAAGPTSRMLVGRAEDFEVGQPVTFEEGQFHLVKQADGSFIALYWKSTHKGCTVPWRENSEFNGKPGWFRDPCSGSVWDVNGVRVFGPAPRDLDRFPVEIRGGNVYVRAALPLLIRADLH